MLRTVEHYTSVQGEGPRTGTLTQFVRFAGCNMRCPGWPCDTQHAIEPNIWRFNSQEWTPEALAQAVIDEYHKTGASNICLTGGEPFMQKSVYLETFIAALAHPTHRFTFEVFTNGSFEFPEWTKYPLIDMLFMMDWKLPGSWEFRTKVEERTKNALFLRSTDGIKFVISRPDDFVAARLVYDMLHAKECQAQFWIGKAWNADEITDQKLVDFIKEYSLPWKLNVQVHKYIWHPEQQGV